MPKLLISMISSAPRAHLFGFPRLIASSGRRSFASSIHRPQDERPPGPFDSPFGSGPSPPRLSKTDQEIFEQLQKQSTGAFSTPRAPPKINQSPDSTPQDVAQADSEIASRAEKIAAGSSQQQSTSDPSVKDAFNKVIEARGKGEELHPDVRRGVPPEFEGDVNPKTGEVGGPKNEPLRWGATGEWGYNGRTTDF